MHAEPETISGDVFVLSPDGSVTFPHAISAAWTWTGEQIEQIAATSPAAMSIGFNAALPDWVRPNSEKFLQPLSPGLLPSGPKYERRQCRRSTHRAHSNKVFYLYGTGQSQYYGD